jgi:hypothetical protein
MFTKIYKSLQQGFQQSWFKVLFQNTAIAKLLSQKEEPSAWVFFSTYLSSWWWNRLWFRSCIQTRDTPQFDVILQPLQFLKRAGIFTEGNCNAVTTYANPDDLALSLSDLQEARILTQDNFELVADHVNPCDLAEALSCLQRDGVLTQDNFELVVTHANPDRLATALSCLQRQGVLTQDNFELVANHANPDSLARALSSLQRAGILDQENRALVANHAAPSGLSLAFLSLDIARILTQDNFELVASHAVPSRLADALSCLQRAGILDQENRALVANHTNPDDLCTMLSRFLTHENLALVASHANPRILNWALCSLQKARILTQPNLELVANHARPDVLARALSSLQKDRILTQPNLELVATHARPDVLAYSLSHLQQAGILNQQSIAALVTPNHAALLTIEAHDRIWGRIPNHLLTTVNFQRLLTAAEHANPMEELQRIVNQILGVQAGAGHAAAFNPSQSTHTASVHESVSASAVRLRNSYGNPLNLEEKIIEIKVYIDGLDNTPEHQAAKRCIERITAADYSFTDPISQVSTRQLLALAYTAIHDIDRCSASLEDAKALFVEGLYESQRGYNIEFGQGPEQGQDAPICVAGTFNKVMEKLNRIHTDVELVFITHEGASSKFQRLAQEHAKDYLQTQVESINTGNHQSVQDLLERLNAAVSLEPIWDAIKTQVQTQLWDEFSKAYGNNPEDARFLALIDHGIDVPFTDVSALETALIASTGDQASPAQACESVAQHGLWASSQSTGACDTINPGVNPP